MDLKLGNFHPNSAAFNRAWLDGWDDCLACRWSNPFPANSQRWREYVDGYETCDAFRLAELRRYGMK